VQLYPHFPICFYVVLIFTRYYRGDEANDGLDGWIENVWEIEMSVKCK